MQGEKARRCSRRVLLASYLLRDLGLRDLVTRPERTPDAAGRDERDRVVDFVSAASGLVGPDSDAAGVS